MEVDDAKRVEGARSGERQAKKLLAQATLDAEPLRAALSKKASSPPVKREAVTAMRKATTISERRASRLVGLARSVLRYESKANPANAELEHRLIELAHERRRVGYRRLRSRLPQSTREFS